MSAVIQYYPLDVGTKSGTNIANLTAGYNVYDASLNGGSYISTSNFRIGKGALAIDASGQYFRINSSLTTTTAGLTFSLWARGNNGVGQYTLLDYSNGAGGNQKITLGIQNNTLFGEVINGTSVGSLTFTTRTTTSRTTTAVTGVAYSSSVNRLVWANYDLGFLYFRTGLSGSDTVINGTAYAKLIDVCMTNDGNRIVFTHRVGICYFATWTGSNYTGIQTVNAEATTRNFQSIDMTEDGGILVATIGAVFNVGDTGVPLWCRWNGTNYSSYNTTLNATADNYIGVAITPDGSRIAYTTATQNVYYAVWNGTNYSDRISIGSVLVDFGLKLKFTKDGNTLIIASYTNLGVGNIQYCVWNGTSFGSLTTVSLLQVNGATFGMALDYNKNLYYGAYNTSSIYKTTFQVSNQYTASNFYSDQNLNDNTWRHIAWTIDPSNTTYKYYINGSLIKTDASSGYTFPASTARTNNLLGTSTDLSLSYFIGGIDSYRVYSGVLTDTQISTLYKTEAYNGLSQIQYYTFDTPAFSSNSLGNYVSGSYIYDASLNAYQGANLVQNGEFKNGTTGWTTSGSVSSATFGTTYNRESIPSNITTFGYLNTTAGSYISQSITFPKAGNYALTFYSSQYNGVCTLQIDIGSLYSKTYSYSDYYWTPITVSLYVSASQTQTLKFTMATGTQQIWLTGITVLNTDDYVSTTGFRNNSGSLSLDNSGQIVKMNAPFTTTTSGLTYAFWARGNNGVGQNTLLDYSNGAGGNQKITLGLQNNTLYGQVVNGTSISTPLTFTNNVSLLSTASIQIHSICITADGKRLSYGDYGSGIIYTYNYNGSSWGTPVTLTLTTSNPVGLCCTADGSRLVISRRNGGTLVYATWNGSSYTGLTTTGFSISQNDGIDMTPDGRILVVATGQSSNVNSSIYYSIWNTTTNNYTTFTATGSSLNKWYSVSITTDGSRIAYTLNGDLAYYLTWNNATQTYSNETAFTTLTASITTPKAQISKDGNIVFIISNSASATGCQYAVWNGTAYSSLMNIPSGVIPTNYIMTSGGTAIGWDNTVYLAQLNNSGIIKFTFQVSNQYLNTNFYSAQNLNDNTWRHIAWTIDPSNTTYKYYINGSLIKTDASSGYIFPASTTRTNNLLGTSADLPLSYYVGGIANYQTYNGVLTDAQILALYNTDAYSRQTPVEYYTGDYSSVYNNLLTNSITGVSDAVLTGGATITTTDYKTGITSTGYGQYVKINSSLTTTATNSGLTFAFWLRSKNSSSINPLLEYSNGKGNNKVGLSLWNGSPYAQVISDVSLGTVALTVDAGFSKTNTGNIFGITVSADHKRMAIITTTGVYYATYSSGAWSAYTTLVTATITGGGIAMSSDGYYLVWNQRTAYTYFSLWNSITGTYGTATQTLDTNYRTFTNMHMTADGARIIACGGYESAVLYANWNGSNYSAYITIPPVSNTIYLTCSATTPLAVEWGTPTAGNVFLNTVTQPETYYVWASANSSSNTYYSDDTRLFILEYNYNNTTGSSITATLYYIVDDAAYFYFNGVVQNGGSLIGGGYPNGNTISLTLPTGNNRFQFACKNMITQGPAAFSVIVKSNTGTLLFNTNATNSGWILTNPYCGMAITPDGNRIFYGIQVLTGNSTTTNSLYYADWDPTQNNYGSGTLIGVVNSNNSNYLRNIRCTPDGNAVFVSSYGTSFVSWYVFNGTTFVAQNSLSISTNDVYALENVWDGSNKYLYVGYSTSLTRYTYTVSNAYTQTNFYTAQNLNDGVWRHLAWTIDPSTTTYKYYLNGSLIKTDTSTNYVFPSKTTRTNNLLFSSTDLSLSYYVGSIDNYRVYTGVLTDTQISTLFQTDAYGGQSPILFQNYTFNQGTNSGVNLINASTNLYDAILNGGAYISTTNYITGTGALALDTSGQYVKMNNTLTTTATSGLTFSLWARGNNGVGQYTLLDYSNGAGGNQRISLGLQNNTLLGQVVNGTTLGSLTFSTAQTSTIPSTGITGLAYSKSADRFLFTDFNNGYIYYRSGFTGTDISFASGNSYPVGACITNDGSRVVWSIRNGNCYYATWNGTTYSGITAINSGATTGIQGIDMTDDGQILVVAKGTVGIGASGVPLWAYWTGSMYSTYRTILGASTLNYLSIAITPDGNRIAFSEFSNYNIYYATWNGTNYSNTTLIANVGENVYGMRFSKDGNILFLNIDTGNTLRYFIWNGSSFGSIQTTTVFNSITTGPYGISVDYNNTIYGSKFGSTTLLKTTFQVSNQYSNTNFYSAQNLNDNTWRHIAWTIDPSNTTYKYYINGSLIKTDASSGYVFPASTTRTNNLLGVSTDLSLSYFVGGIDQYRVQTGVLTDAQIYTLFQSDAYSNRSLIQYYTFDPSFNTGTNIANLSTNSATGVYDASLNGGAYISTTNKKIGAGALAIDVSGQNVRFNSPIVFSNIGLTFAFWARGNNGVGQYTLLDYSNGAGGNNKITLGLQNNTLYGQVVNGTSISTPLTFTNYTTDITPGYGSHGICMTSDGTRLITCDHTSGNVFTYIYSNSTWSLSGTLYVGNTPVGVCCTADGSRLVISFRGGYLSYATWNGSNYSGLTTTGLGFVPDGDVDMTPDGRILLVSTGTTSTGANKYVYYSIWNSSTNNYSTFTIANGASGTKKWYGAAITADGSRIAYTDQANNLGYYSLWNNATQSYGNETAIVGFTSTICKVKFSKDGNIMFVGNMNASVCIQYAIWNGTSYSSLINVPSSVTPLSYNISGMFPCYDGSFFIGAFSPTSTTILKFTFQVSNQYSNTNFYSAQNLNDNTWRHIAWTIDPSNTTYKYYINGSLIKTDTSSGYIFPAPTTRKNNLLLTGTDLSLSYFIGGIDNYRMYSRVLTDAQIAVLAAETVSEGTLTTLYPLDTTSGINIANNASGSYVYDASLNGGATISTTNYKVGIGSLSLDTSGQYLKINTSLTNTTGLSFLFWSRANNGTGQTTLLDYSGGPGGNQKITYGLQNNQIYAQVTNGSTVGTLTFSTAQTSSLIANAVAVAYAPTTNIMVYATTTGVLYVRTGGITGTQDVVAVTGTYPGINNLFLTSDGNRMIWSIRGGDVYYAQWTGSIFSNPQVINTGALTIQGMDMTDDGSILAVVCGNVFGGMSGSLQWAYWTGSQYSTYKTISNASVGDFASCAIIPDGSRIIYLEYNTNVLYYALWNGTNYVQNNTTWTTPTGCRNMKTSKDGNILFITYPGTTNVLRYSVWDGTTYGSPITINTTTVFDNVVQSWGLWVDYNNAVYTIDYNNTVITTGGISTASTTLYKTTFQASNQYTATHFYAQENLNNSVWRQCAWTIDPYTFTYKYYINGTLIKTDTSSNYVFPDIASRSRNQLGVSTDLSLSYFKGKIDYYRVYNGILTDTQIATAYQNEVYSFQPLAQYYSLETEATELVQNGYFSLPNMSGGFNSTGAPTGWNYVRVTTPADGYQFTSGNNGIGVNTLVPSGATQYIFLLDNGSNINQDITFPCAGNYLLTYYASARSGNTYSNIQIRVNIGTTVVDKITPLISNNWVKYSVSFYVNSASTQNLKFQDYSPTYNGEGPLLVGVSIVSNNTQRLANYATGVCAYDASLNTGTTVSSNQYKIGSGCLSLDAKGQYTNLSPLTTTANAGLSISCWVKANNKCGPSTLLDYNNGLGGNQRISMGYQNNTLLAQVVNGTSLSSPTFTTYSLVDTISSSILKSVAVYSPTNRIIYVDNSSNKIFVKNATDTVYTSIGYTGSGLINNIDITSDGSRIVWCVATDYCYYATWNGTTYSNVTTINQTGGTMNIYCVDITEDGNTLAVFTATGMFWAKWTGNGYSVYTQTTTAGIKTNGVMTPDGSKIAYLLNGNQLYYETWDGSTFTNPVFIGSIYSSGSTKYSLLFSKDGNILFSTSSNVSTSLLQYTIWNGTGYGSIITTSVFSAPLGLVDLKLDYNNTIYTVSYDAGQIIKTTYKIPNQYVATNFYSAQNLNDNTWRHIAWTIDPINTRYMYYLNGSLIYTDVSTGYVFPAQTTRTNNLLGISTDLSMSYFTGAIDNYRVYNGVLTPQEINMMYNYENTGINTLLSYYPLDALSYAESYVGNYKTGIYVYDATMVGGATITSKSNPPVGTKALNLDVSGQYLKMNSSFTTTATSGLTFSLWFKGNNGCGQYTLLDYSNGSGGNNRISLGIQDNNLLAQVVNGTTIGSLSFSSTQIYTIDSDTYFGVAYSASVNRLILISSSVIYFKDGFTGQRTAIGTGYTGLFRVCVTSDGSRIVWSTKSNCYYATWNGTTYSNITTINSGAVSGIQGLDMTDDGQKIIITLGIVGTGSTGAPLWAYWTGSGYSAYIPILNTPSTNNVSCAITPDGSRIAFSNYTTYNLYYALWNGTNYSSITSPILYQGVFNYILGMKFSKDGNILFLSAYGAGSTNLLNYIVWNGTSYSSLQSVSSINGLGGGGNSWGLCLDYNNNIYACGAQQPNKIYKTTFQVSNQYFATNFYSAQNLNDNAWRHIAWTIDPSNTTYKYYINGSLIKTDASSGYIFPASTTRTNNLLGVSTDLSMSYMTGNITQYRVQTGVLTDAQIYSLYTSDAYNSQSTIQYYSFDTASISGTNMGNYASNTYYEMDASLNGGAYITTSNAVVGTGSLSLDTSGQYVRLNNNFSTSTGLSFVFWARSNNGSGHYTLLDYSNGQGGNNKISLGLRNNTLYSQVVNGTSVGTVSILTDTFTKSHTGSLFGLAFSANHQVMAISAGNGVYYSTYSSGTWSDFTTVITGIYGNADIAITGDGSRIVWIVSGSYCYFANWDISSNNYTGITQTAETTARGYISLGMTADGTRIVTMVGTSGYIYTARWTGTNYTVFTQISDSNLRNYIGIAISADGNRLFAGFNDGTNNLLHYSVWNSTTGNYGPTVLAANVMANNSNWIRRVKCSSDGNIVFISSYGATANTPQIACYTFNGTSYVAQTPYVYGSSVDQWAMGTITDGSSNYIYVGYGTTISRFRYTVSNQYIGNNFYSAQNLNDNTWRHIAWTIDPSNTTYKYYINGSLIKTDASSGYIFPGLTTRTNNLLGVSTDLSMSYMTGGIDNYRVYNGVLTDTQINTIFTADAYNSQSLIQYYPFNTASISGTNLGNYVSKVNYVMDASLNGGAYITTSNVIVGTGALSLDTSGQYVRLNNNLVVSSSGLTFSLWFKARGDIGQNTLFDYSNGQGGNNRISLGLQSNTLYSNVVNGNSLGSLTFTTAETTTVSSNTLSSIAYSTSANRLILVNYGTGIIYFRTGMTGSYTAITGTYTNVIALSLTSDGSRLIWSTRAGNCYYAIWDGTTYSSITTINSGALTGTQGIDITDNGQILAVAIGIYGGSGASGVPNWAYWTGSGYSTYRTILNATTANNISIAITPDGNRIAFADASYNIYYANWNGTNYSNPTLIVNAGLIVFVMKFSKDGNILFMNVGSGNVLRYFIWNGSSYGSLQSTTVFNSMGISPWGLAIDYNNTLYGCPWGVTTIFKTTFQVSNQYTASNFYSTQNLNDNTWRHLAWTIDPSNTTYKYYINGYLIKTDISAGYAFPSLTTRKNNLLGTGTDLSLSFLSCNLENYSVYNGVLTDTQVYSLFITDAYNSQSLIQYYSFETTVASGKTALSSGVNGYANIANTATGSNVYDASLNGGASLNNTNYCVGNASLELKGSGNHVRLNNNLTTSGIGLSFALWFRSNNGCGQYTLLDYSNGSGGKNKITLGLHNNTLYGQVINGTGINTPTFTTGVSYSTGYSWPTEIAAFTMSPSTNRFVYTDYTPGKIYYRVGLSGTQVQIATGYGSIAGVAITYDGSRIVFSNRGGYCYFATWSDSISNYTGITTINSGYGAKGFNSLDITGDGRVLVVGVGPIYSGQGTSQKPVWATWNGSGYSTYTDVSGASILPYTSCGVTNDGSRMAYLDYTNKKMYYALWNGSTFVQANNGVTITCTGVYDVRFSRDGNIMFILTQGSYPLQYCIWNGTSYGPVFISNAFSTIASTNGLYVDDTNIYFGSWNTATVYGTTYNISNQYLNTNFYTAQNLNDNTWRHLAWTIDPSNTTYKYYLNGTLIKRDISSGYTFPGLTTMTNNLLGTSTDLSMSYFIGGIDNYMVYNGVITDDQILSLYKTESYSNSVTTSNGGTMVQYYPFNNNKWTIQPALTANYNLVHQYTFDNHTVNEAMLLNTANYTPVYDCRLTNSSTAPTFDTADYKVGNSSLYFSANTLFLQINGVQISALSGVSITCWFKYTSGQLFDFGNAEMDNLSYSPATGITFKNGSTSYTINGGTGKADGTWHHFAWTISSTGTHIVYIDGAVSATTVSVAPVSGTRINNYIGKGVGRVDDFRVYSGVLTLTNIQSLNNLLPPTTTLSMVNYYTLNYNQNDGGFIPNTASGNPVYDGVLCNGTASIPTVDISNNRLGTGCLYLPGTNQYAQIRQVGVTNTGMTISVWLKVAVSPTGGNLYKITDFGNGTTAGYDNYGIYISNTAIGSLVYIGTSSYTVPFSTTTHIDGAWHHLAITMTYSTTNTSTHVLYLDGTAVASSSSARYPVVGIRVNNRIGCSIIGQEFVNGYLNDLRVYNGVMPSTDVLALYNSTQYDKVVKIPNLINHYTFEPTMVGGNYVANMSSNTVKYDMLLGPGVLPTLDVSNYKEGLRGLRLDGAYKQYVQLNNFSVPSSVGLTIACWFKYTSVNGSCLFDLCNTINTGSDRISYSPNNGLDFRVGTTVQNTGASSGKADGTWHHFAWSMVYVASGNTTHKVYIDATPTTYTTWLYPTTGVRTYNYIGKSTFTANDYSTGYVDDFRIYYGVLTDTDVSGVFGSSSYSTSIQPAVYYKFE